MYKTILVPIDLSHKERIQPMLAAARHLGGKNARLILVSIVEEIPAYVASQLPAGAIDGRINDTVEELKAVAVDSGIKAEIEVRNGHPGAGILDIAEEKGADLIVVASHRPGWEDYLIGSTAGRVVRHAKCSVHVLR
jgi:nucleotide-binding universal stress UspA family protein